MALDIDSHMEGLKMDAEHVAREAASRRYEDTKLSDLQDIFEICSQSNISVRKKSKLNTLLGLLTREVDNLNTSRLGVVSSGGNGEILSRLVAAEILVDFPTVEIHSDIQKPEILYEWEMIRKPNNPENLSIRTHLTRLHDIHEGRGELVTTSAEFKFNILQINSRRDVLTKEIEQLNAKEDKLRSI